MGKEPCALWGRDGWEGHYQAQVGNGRYHASWTPLLAGSTRKIVVSFFTSHDIYRNPVLPSELRRLGLSQNLALGLGSQERPRLALRWQTVGLSCLFGYLQLRHKRVQPSARCDGRP